jgi:hypothetical protein
MTARRKCRSPKGISRSKHSILDGSHKPLRIGIRVGSRIRRLHHASPSVVKPFTYRRAPLRIPIADQDTIPIRTGHRERPDDLVHERVVRMRRAPEHLYPASGEIDHEHRVERHPASDRPYLAGEEICAAMVPQCARRNVCHDVGRCGAGGSPWAFKIRAIVDRPTRWPTFFNAAESACNHTSDCPPSCVPPVA